MNVIQGKCFCLKLQRIFLYFLKDYELQLLTYKALQDPTASPLKEPKIVCASDNIIQEVGFYQLFWYEFTSSQLLLCQKSNADCSFLVNKVNWIFFFFHSTSI